MTENSYEKKTNILLIECYWFIYYFSNAITLLFFKENPKLGTAANIFIKAVYLIILICYSAIYKRKVLFQTKEISSQYKYMPIPVILLCIWVFISILWTSANLYSSLGYWVMLLLEVIPVIVYIFLFPFDLILKGTVNGIIYGGLTICIIAVFNGFSQTGRLGNEDFFHPNIIGNLTAIALITYFTTMDKRRCKSNIYNIVIVGFFASVLLLTVCKTAIIAFIITLIVFTFIIQTKSSSFGQSVKLLIMITPLVIGILMFFGKYTSTYFNKYLETEKLVRTLTGRTLIWDISIQLIKENWILGYGFMAFREVIGGGLFHVRIGSAHNDYLNVLFNFGAVGLTLYIYVLLLYLIYSLKVLKYIKQTNYINFAICLFIYFFIRGMTEGNLTSFNFLMPLLILNITYLKKQLTQIAF